MAEKTIKVLQFPYVEAFEDPFTQTTLLREKIGLRGQTVDITHPEDLRKGEELDAFYTDEELKAGATADDAGATPPPQGAPDPAVASVDDLATWMEDTQATVQDVLNLANDNPEHAEKLLEAENQASGGDPRKGVESGLTKIAERNAE